ncbi:hypothetical protein [Lysobacter xanthus]
MKWLGFSVLFGFATCYLGMIFVAVPAVKLLARAGLYRALPVCTTAVLVGTVLACLAAGLFSPNVAVWRTALIGAFFGLVSGLAFYYCARPNNSSKPTPLRGAA